MGTRSGSTTQMRFGAFHLDLEAGELRNNGSRVALQDQPFRVLAMLVERPGKVVTREELQQKLWPDDTFVEFDRSLNTAVNKVRDALGDSATAPQFVETVPRRGYRFIVAVEAVGEEAGAGPGSEAAIAAEGEPRIALSRYRGWAATVCAGLLVALSAAWVAWRPSVPGKEPPLRRF